MKYAANTSVSTFKSREEIERTVSRFGAQGFIYGWEDDVAVIGFRMNGRFIKFRLPMLNRQDRAFTHTTKGLRKPAVAEKQWEQACRQAWRGLSAVIKAQFIAIEAGVVTLEDAFLAYTQLPDGTTVGEFMASQVEQAYLDASMPRMLPLYNKKKPRRKAR